jgi:hypothetical protein
MSESDSVSPEVYLQHDIRTAQALRIKDHILGLMHGMLTRSDRHCALAIDFLAEGKIGAATKHYVTIRDTIVCGLRDVHKATAEALQFLEAQPETVEEKKHK